MVLENTGKGSLKVLEMFFLWTCGNLCMGVYFLFLVHCFTGLFWWRLLQVKPGPERSSKENLLRNYSPEAHLSRNYRYQSTEGHWRGMCVYSCLFIWNST